MSRNKNTTSTAASKPMVKADKVEPVINTHGDTFFNIFLTTKAGDISLISQTDSPFRFVAENYPLVNEVDTGIEDGAEWNGDDITISAIPVRNLLFTASITKDQMRRVVKLK